MTRTVLTSIAKTCTDCGAANTVVAATTEIRPFWHMHCRRCGAALSRGRHSEPEHDAGRNVPAKVGAATPPARGSQHSAAAAPRRRRGTFWRCCTGLNMAAGAALGAICTALLLGTPDGPETSLRDGEKETILATAPGVDRADGAPLATAPRGNRATGSGSTGPGSTGTGLSGTGLSGAGLAVAELAGAELAGAELAGAGLASAAPSADDARHTEADWEAAVEAALEQELARLEVHLRDPDRGRRLAEAAPPVDPEAAARAEAALDLSRRERRFLQRRLALAEHDPRMVDGIFGPATRAAIAAWQSAAGLPPSGFFDGDSVALLERQTEERFRAWQVAAERDRRRRTRTAVATGPAPAVSAASARCQRTWSGEITYGQNVACDLRGLRENVVHLLRVADRS